jgi:molybdate transport system permease protein
VETDALLLTLRLALVTTALLMVIALPLAGWLALGRTRLRFLVEALVALPLVLPPTVLGFYLLMGLGPLTAVGRMIVRLLGHPLAFSFSGLVVGSVIYSLPFAVQPVVAGLRAVDRHILETASTLGAPPLRVFRTVALPLAKASVLAAAILTFMHTVGEFGVVLMLGGNIPGRTQTISIAIFDAVQDFDYSTANRSALFLLLLSTVALLFVYGRSFLRRNDA